MRLGIIGLPQSGKTTVFNALTRGNLPITTSGGRFEVHTGVVDVPDARVDRLSAMFKPKKTIYAKVTYADIAGLEGKQSEQKTSDSISGALLNQLTQMDGFLHVVHCFEDDSVPHPAGSVDPQPRYRRHGFGAADQRPDRRRAQARAAGGGTQKRAAGAIKRSSSASSSSSSASKRTWKQDRPCVRWSSLPKMRKPWPGSDF